MSKYFDLVDSQHRAQEMRGAKQLFEFWEWVCSLYDNHEIGANEFGEIRSVIWGQFRHIDALNRVRIKSPSRWFGSRDVVSSMCCARYNP